MFYCQNKFTLVHKWGFGADATCGGSVEAARATVPGPLGVVKMFAYVCLHMFAYMFRLCLTKTRIAGKQKKHICFHWSHSCDFSDSVFFSFLQLFGSLYSPIQAMTKSSQLVSLYGTTSYPLSSWKLVAWMVTDYRNNVRSLHHIFNCWRRPPTEIFLKESSTHLPGPTFSTWWLPCCITFEKNHFES